MQSNRAARTPTEVPTCFDEAFNRADLDAVLALFNEPATMRMTHGQVVQQDRRALRDSFSQLLALRPHIRNEVRHTLSCDDIALVVMDWTLTMTTPDGRAHCERGTATQVMQRQADRTWRLKISNPLGVA
jgi:uncharacterized protein (TIGR02246 family)